MSTIIEKLNEIFNIKNNIKQSIINKGVDVPDNTPFANYPDKINNITGGSGSGSGSGDGSYYESLYNQMTNNGYSMRGLLAYSQAREVDLIGLDFSNMEDARYMFYNCNARINLGQCDTSNLRMTMSMFDGFTNGNNYIDISVFDFSNVTEPHSMFANSNVNYIDVRNINLDFSKIYNAEHLFSGCGGDTLDLSNWNITGLTNMGNMFYNCQCKAINLTGWATNNVENMGNLFWGCSNLQELIIPNWDMTNVQNYWSMLDGCNNLRYVDIRNCNADTVSKIIEQLPNKSEANYGEIELPEGSSQDFINMAMNKYWKPTSLEVTPVTSGDLSIGLNQIMIGEKTLITLSNCTPWYGTRDNIVFVSSNTDAVIIEGNKAKAVGIGEAQIIAINSATQETISNNPVTISVTEIDANPGLIMFKANDLNIEREIWIGQVNNQEYNSRQLSYDNGVYSLDVGAPITQLRFYENSNISEIVKLNMSSMTNLQEVFYNCTNLEYVDANNWVNANTTQVHHLFTNCTNLKELDISNWDAGHLGYINYVMGCTNLNVIRMDNCSNATIRKAIDGDFPRNNVGTIYCKRANAEGIQAPGNWSFSYID